MDLDTVRNFLIALLIGALVGIEREKRKAAEPGPTFGGIRTYTLLALVGATSAWLSRLLGSPKAEAAKSSAPPLVKQYREADGLFYVKLTQGELQLLLSPGFAQGREAGDWWKATKAAPHADPAVDAALQLLRAQDEAKAAAKSPQANA